MWIYAGVQILMEIKDLGAAMVGRPDYEKSLGRRKSWVGARRAG